MVQTVTDFLRLLKIPISKKYVQKLIQSHPDFPSLLSVSDTLQRLSIAHAASMVKKEELLDLPCPYLLSIDKGVGDLLLIKDIRDLDKNKSELEFWNGVVLQAESTKLIKDKINNELYSKERKIKGYLIGLFSILLISLFTLFLSSFNWQLLLLLITAIVGSSVGYFLVAKDLGITYKAVDDFCNAGKNTNCDKVLKADIQLWGIGFSDAALAYFVFQTIALVTAWVLQEINQVFLSALASISLLTIPVVVFSLYYQYFVVKTWCRLCLVVASVLVVQFALFLPITFDGILFFIKGISLIPLVALGFLFISVGVCVKAVKTIVERANQLNKGSNADRIKYSIPVFTQLLKQQKKIDSTPFEREVLLGNPNASIKIIMVTNLYCSPCKEKHEVIEELVATYPDKVSVSVRFVKSGKDVDNVSAVWSLLGYWLNHVYGKTDEESNTASLIHNWFLISDLQKFKMKYPSDQNNDEETKEMEQQHYVWAGKAGIQITPTFFVNGCQLPKEYAIDDIANIVPSLAYTMEDSSSIFAM